MMIVMSSKGDPLYLSVYVHHHSHIKSSVIKCVWFREEFIQRRRRIRSSYFAIKGNKYIFGIIRLFFDYLNFTFNSLDYRNCLYLPPPKH